jgi:hypothetical protein
MNMIVNLPLLYMTMSKMIMAQGKYVSQYQPFIKTVFVLCYFPCKDLTSMFYFADCLPILQTFIGIKPGSELSI